jgi:hypothetical protein
MNDNAIQVSNPKSFTPEELRKIQEENPEGVEVYEFEYEKVDRVLPALEVGGTMVDIKKRYDAIRAEKRDLTDEEVQELLVAEDKAWKSFATHTHPTFFEKVTTRTTPPSVVTNLLAMIQTKHLIETGQADEETAMMAMQQSLQQEYLHK